MANVKITALPLLTPAATDVLPVVDVSADITKKATVEDISKNAGNGTAAVPSHSFASDSDTGLFRAGTNRLAITTAGVQRAEFDATGNLLIGGTLPSAANISLNADGTTSFAGKILYHRTSAPGGTSAIQVKDGSSTVFRVYANGETVITNTAYFGSAGTTRLYSNGKADITSDLVVGQNSTLFANGNARFPGSVSIGGTAAANTIDSYEEGTFTPTVQFGGSGTGLTFASRTGSYTKIGNQVTVYVYLNLSNKGSSTGNATIKPLPFTAAQINASGLVGWPGVIAARQQNFSNLTTSNPNISVTAASNGVGLLLRTVAGVNLTDANFTNGSTLEFQVTYTVN